MAFDFYRRRLPHARIDGAVYFATWRLRQGLPDLSAGERDIVAEALRHFDDRRYVLHAYVVMNDHVHVIVEPLDGFHLENILHSWKSFSAHLIGERRHQCGALWQGEYFDRALRDELEYEQKREYILTNPFRRWPTLESYRWCWAIGLFLS